MNGIRHKEPWWAKLDRFGHEHSSNMNYCPN